jgi:hypothetical protein
MLLSNCKLLCSTFTISNFVMPRVSLVIGLANGLSEPSSRTGARSCGTSAMMTRSAKKPPQTSARKNSISF